MKRATTTVASGKTNGDMKDSPSTSDSIAIFYSLFSNHWKLSNKTKSNFIELTGFIVATKGNGINSMLSL
jgi:hypothetical protein